MTDEPNFPHQSEARSQAKPEPTAPQNPQEPPNDEIRSARPEQSTLSARRPLFRS